VRTLGNISERRFYADFFRFFFKPAYVSTIEWAKKYRVITSKESSFGIGNFDPNLTPYMEYVYECLDNPYIANISAMKSARIAWTETLNNYRGKRIHINPTSMLLGFATRDAARSFAKGKWQEFLRNIPVLKTIVDVGVSENKKSLFDYTFPHGSLKLVTLGSISNQKSDNYEYIEIEEPDDAKDDVKGQGDTFDNLKERQKLVPITRKKFIFGGTPTFKDFSRVEKAILASNQLVFKACCHECESLIPMDGSSFDHIVYDEFQDRKIDEIYGKYNPETAMFLCPVCKTSWDFDQKKKNIIKGKEFGFTDHTGNFSKGWHPKKPEITEVFGFIFSEMLSPFPASDFKELAKAKILAELELTKGNEKPMKSYTNNKKGMPYASGVSAMEVDEMVALRSNYPEHVCPMEGLVLTAGVDVQDNRFAIVIRAWGRNNNSWLVTWKEIFGEVKVQEWDNEGKPLGVWGELWDILLAQHPHASGKTIPISAASIDAADNTELVYRFILAINEHHEQIFATKGVRDLRFSDDEIYREPSLFDIRSDPQARKTLAERMGVTVYNLGAHRAHNEILNRVALNKNKEARSNVYYFNAQSYGQYEQQMLSCRKLIDVESSYSKEVFKLIPGKRKEAMDAEKMALHSSYAIGVRLYTNEHFRQLEAYYYA
jgi:phage terminase large subunit GpA-like protein